MTVRALADLGQGARGQIVELRMPPGRRTLPSSPLRPGATVYVAEATGGRWLHVRIDYREYSIPLGVAEGVLIEVPEASARRRHGELSGDAEALDAAAFRARYRLP
ncbi:MAG: FeoA domain-containing protein [Actinomycetota bacterium]